MPRMKFLLNSKNDFLNFFNFFTRKNKETDKDCNGICFGDSKVDCNGDCFGYKEDEMCKKKGAKPLCIKNGMSLGRITCPVETDCSCPEEEKDCNGTERRKTDGSVEAMKEFAKWFESQEN